MKLTHRCTIIALGLILLGPTSSPVGRQLPAPQPKQTEQQQKAQKELEKKALILLDEILNEAQSLKRPENRLTVLATVADLLWPHDEKKARTVLADLISSFSQLAGSRDVRDHRQLYFLHELRQKVLKTIAQHDVALAREFLLNTRPPPPETERLHGEPNFEADLEMSLVAQIATQDPKEAVKLAEESLAHGVSYRTLEILFKLQQKDAAAAQKLGASVVKKLRPEDLKTNPQNLHLVINLVQFQSNPDRLAQAYGRHQPKAPKAAPLLAEADYRELLSAVTTFALETLKGNLRRGEERDSQAGLYHSLPGIMPEIEKHWPAQAPALRAKLDQLDQAQDEPARVMRRLESLMTNGTTDAMLEAAAKVPAEMKHFIYQTAAWKALSEGQLDRARQILNDHVPDSPERQQMLANFEQMALRLLLEKEKIAEARQLIAQVNDVEERALLLAQLAIAVGKTDKKQALQLLEEARSLTGPQTDNAQQLEIQMRLAQAYTTLDIARSFELLEPILDQINTLVAALALVDKFQPKEQQQFRDGEVALLEIGHSQDYAYRGGSTSLQMLSYSAGLFRPLAVHDFERTKALTDRLARSDLRLMARLALAQSILITAEPPAATDNFWPGPGYTFYGPRAFVEHDR